MKFYLIAVMTTILTVGMVSAQNVNFGIKGGLNIYNINQENNSTFDPKAGVHFGLLAHIHLAEQFAIQPELLYSIQGTKYTMGGTETKYNLDYVNIPVLFQYMFDNGFRLYAGPQVGFLVSAKSKTNNLRTEIKNDFKSIDFGLGLGMSYVHPPSGFGFDARYNLGLSNISNNSAKAFNRGVQLGIFYLFKHKS